MCVRESTLVLRAQQQRHSKHGEVLWQLYSPTAIEKELCVHSKAKILDIRLFAILDKYGSSNKKKPQHGEQLADLATDSLLDIFHKYIKVLPYKPHSAPTWSCAYTIKHFCLCL